MSTRISSLAPWSVPINAIPPRSPSHVVRKFAISTLTCSPYSSRPTSSLSLHLRLYDPVKGHNDLFRLRLLTDPHETWYLSRLLFSEAVNRRGIIADSHVIDIYIRNYLQLTRVNFWRIFRRFDRCRSGVRCVWVLQIDSNDLLFFDSHNSKRKFPYLSPRQGWL